MTDQSPTSLRYKAERVARIFDVPPWVVSPEECPRPRFARVRWALRRVWPSGVWHPMAPVLMPPGPIRGPRPGGK